APKALAIKATKATSKAVKAASVPVPALVPRQCNAMQRCHGGSGGMQLDQPGCRDLEGGAGLCGTCVEREELSKASLDKGKRIKNQKKTD
ncbi:hypothetical protein B484DRAFT_406372, partial [Ochromonadaceae sp. CCMP2298]